MSGTKIIKQLLAERNLTINQLSELLNIQPQSMRNKLYRDKFSFADMCKICHVLGADLCAITQDTHKEFYGNLEHSTAPQETRPISPDASDLTKRSVSSGIDLPENIDSDFQRDVPNSQRKTLFRNGKPKTHRLLIECVPHPEPKKMHHNRLKRV